MVDQGWCTMCVIVRFRIRHVYALQQQTDRERQHCSNKVHADPVGALLWTLSDPSSVEYRALRVGLSTTATASSSGR